MRKKSIYGSIIFLCLFIIEGCHHFVEISDEESIQIELPIWPPENSCNSNYPDLYCWKIIIDKPEKSQTFYTSTQAIFISCHKNEPVCITCYPLTKTINNEPTNYFYPAGFIYPYSSFDKNTGHATWEQGYICEIMHRIINSKKETGVSIEHLREFLKSYNWKKMQEYIEKKIQESKEDATSVFFNPWLIDSQRLLDNLCYGNFKSAMLNITGIYTFTIEELFQHNKIISPFIPENEYLYEKNSISLPKNRHYFISDGFKDGFVLTSKSAKNVSKEYIYMPIYIEDI